MSRRLLLSVWRMDNVRAVQVLVLRVLVPGLVSYGMLAMGLLPFSGFFLRQFLLTFDSAQSPA
jgi:hypothetical protein